MTPPGRNTKQSQVSIHQMLPYYIKHVLLSKGQLEQVALISGFRSVENRSDNGVERAGGGRC